MPRVLSIPRSVPRRTSRACSRSGPCHPAIRRAGIAWRGRGGCRCRQSRSRAPLPAAHRWHSARRCSYRSHLVDAGFRLVPRPPRPANPSAACGSWSRGAPSHWGCRTDALSGDQYLRNGFVWAEQGLSVNRVHGLDRGQRADQKMKFFGFMVFPGQRSDVSVSFCNLSQLEDCPPSALGRTNKTNR